MPETQQEWLEKQIRSVLRRQSEGEHGKAIVPTGEIATHLASAWPSSPQGVQHKALVEALKAASEALAPPGHFEYAADRAYAIGKAYNAIQAALKLEEETT